MQRQARVVSSVVVIGLVLLTLPFFMGYCVKRDYEQMVAFYNKQSDVHLQIINYQRGWFCSRATLMVDTSIFTDPAVPEAKLLELMVKQRIYHGPLILSFHNHHWLTLAAAVIRNTATLSANSATTIQATNKNLPLINWQDKITFAGNFKTYFHIAEFKMTLPDGVNQLQFRGFAGRVQTFPSAHRIKAAIQNDTIVLLNHDLALRIPSVKLVFDQHETPQQLWIGSTTFTMPQLILNGGDKTFIMLGMHLSGNQAERAGFINGNKTLHIDKISMGTDAIGPLDIDLNAHNFNAQALSNLIQDYRTLLQAGAKQNLTLRLLPKMMAMITAQSTLQVNKAKLVTPSGDVNFNANIKWQDKNANGQAQDKMLNAKAQGELRISRALLHQFMHVMAVESFQDDGSANPLVGNQKFDLASVQRENELFLSLAMREGQLKPDVGKKLLALQKNNVPFTIYNAELDALVVAQQITPQLKVLLQEHYLNIDIASMPVEQQRAVLENKLELKLEDYIHAGFVNLNANEYSVQFTLDSGILKFNDKVF